MADYIRDIYKAISCKTPTKGATMFIDDFGDVWTLIPQLNRFNEMSVYRQYTGNIVIAPFPLGNTAQGQHLYIGELIPTYHISISCPVSYIQNLQHQIYYYLQGRLGKVQARFNKKPLRLKS